jgi:hypothetical protein
MTDSLGWGETLVVAGANLIPVVGGAVGTLMHKAYAMDRERVAQTGRAAIADIGDPDVFVQRLTSDERLLDMCREAFEASARSSTEAKRIAMGRVMARAVVDDAQLDDSAELLSALARLESQHFRLLGQIELALGSDEMAAVPVPEPYKSALISAGTVQTGTTYGGATTIGGLTDFGERLLAYLRDATERPSESDG